MKFLSSLIFATIALVALQTSATTDVNGHKDCIDAATAAKSISQKLDTEEKKCRTLFEKLVALTKDPKMKETQAAKLQDAQVKECKTAFDKFKAQFMVQFDKGMNNCNTAIGDAQTKANEEAKKAELAIAEINDGNGIIAKGNKDYESAAKSALPVQPAISTIQFGQQRVKEAEVKQEAADWNNLDFLNKAQTADERATEISQQYDAIKDRTLEMEQAVTASDTITKALLPDPSQKDLANNERRNDTPSGAPGSSTGQGGSGGPGGSPSSGGQQAGQQDQAGGAGSGGGGLPSFPSGSSKSDSLSNSKTPEPKQDCSNPSVAASNPVCTCRINPGDSRCASILAADKLNSATAKKALNMYNGEEGGGGGFTTGGGGYKEPKEKNISQHGQMAQGPGGSVGKGVGSGQGSQVASNGKNDPRGRQTGKTAAGSRGIYGGGGGAVGSVGATIGQPNSRIPSTFAKAPLKSRLAANPLTGKNLNEQMQMRFNNQRRNPAGAIGPDGITGPHTDQFKKIRLRYAEALGL